MKLHSTILCLSMLAGAVPAFAQGQLFLNFSDCTPSARNKDLDCASTTATTVLVASATPATNVPGVIADLGYIDVLVGSDPSSLPPFWQFQSGGCAGSSRILFSADFTANTNCVDVWAGLGSTGGQWGGALGPVPDGNRARVKWTTTVIPDLAFPMAGGDQAYIERITLGQASNATCPGCAAPACAVYLDEALSLLNGSTYRITGGVTGAEFLTFNDSQSLTRCGGPPDPARNSTWGRVKSLYR